MTELRGYERLDVDVERLLQVYERRNDGLSVIVAAENTRGFQRVDCAKDCFFRVVYLNTPEGRLALTFPWRDPASRELEGTIQVFGDSVSAETAREYVDDFCRKYECTREGARSRPKRRSANFWWAWEYLS